MSALRKVLVVDDDPVVGTSYSRVLSNKGYAVITAHDAAEALEQLRREEVDLVVTDIKMPGMDGLQLAEAVKARRPWTPVVIVTGYGTQADEARARAAGVSAFLHKPLSPEMIEDSAADALRGAPAALPTPALAPDAPEPAGEAAIEGPANRIRDIALFFAAPFIGLVYALFLPVVGLGIAAKYGYEAMLQNARLRPAAIGLRWAATLVAAPFIGLAYIVVLPFAGIATLAWMAGKAVFVKREAD
jgi:two-component system response regulator HydG